MTEPTLQDDEAALQRYASVLLDATAQVIEIWIHDSIVTRNPDLAALPAASEAVETGSKAIMGELRTLLMSDIAEQTNGPLQILRAGTRFASAVLADADTPTIARDAFAQQAFPDDVYDLAPANFADVDPSLHEPGLVWGAAKAHVHLRRRREAGEL